RTAATLIDDRLEVFDFDRGQLLHRVRIDKLKETRKFRMMWVHECLFSISPHGDLVLVLLDSSKQFEVVRHGKLGRWADVDGGFVEAVFSADGRWVALRSKQEGRILFRGTAADAPATKATGGPIHAVAPDGSMLVVAPNESEKSEPKLRLLDTRTGKP